MSNNGSRTFLRTRENRGHARVTYVELFFDLVFVFAVTQLSHLLLKDLTLLGALRTGLLFLAVWWVWIYTSWVTNWLDPERTPVRLLLFVLMLAGLVLSTSIPDAFGPRGLAFAAAYAFMQVGRSLFMIWALGEASPRNRRNFERITVWLAAAGIVWIAGALFEGARLALWTAALAIEFASPALDDQLELARLHDRKIRGLCALEDAAGIRTDLTPRIRQARSVAQVPAWSRMEDRPTSSGRLGCRNTRQSPELRQLTP
jgi:low temperature requirement protein LtrA